MATLHSKAQVGLVQVIFLVEDLERSAAKLESLGFEVLDGGRHLGRGTANRILPLGEQYIELLAVVDEQEANASPMGKPVLDALRSRGEGPARWSVTSSDLERISERLELPVEDRHRTLPDGSAVRWQAVGVNEAWVQPWRCAFMSWAEQAASPARMPHNHPNQASSIAALEVGVPEQGALSVWLDGARAPGVREIVGSPPGPIAVTIATANGELRLS